MADGSAIEAASVVAIKNGSWVREGVKGGMRETEGKYSSYLEPE